MDVRSGGMDDIEGVLAFWREAAEGTDRFDSADKIVALVERDPEALLLAELGGELVGTLIAGWDGWRAHLYRLAVHPGHRRKGIATTLLRAAETRFAAFGAFRADAMVLHDNTLAHHAWTAAGYDRQPQWGRWVKPLPPVTGR
ncbi:GNAT family N-acetyltransferase [Spongiactinospora sp. TRM90649]|uniref:GNAT family N-acetyltransferase n=1 Tax=Spongiactinospora sp. TRM90649 TaxID=3031114 RepID=UPI0023F95633|nr:GNAT family N-acetyltransferase [Spongiactinospora sp. TRM90649]MDF5757824.1 GNAT family N-acetyltransferase [Spongiactinospora sp. TRM90649]